MGNNQSFGNLIEVGDVILHSDILTEYFCCDIESCHGRCCEEGDAGAPVTLDEIADIEKLGTLTGLNYHRWNICQEAIRLGTERGIRLYEFLREPLIRRFGGEWYDKLCTIANELTNKGIL